MKRLVHIIFIACAVFSSIAVTAEPVGEWTLITSWTTGDYGTDDKVDTWSSNLQYILGDDWQLRVDLPYLVMDHRGLRHRRQSRHLVIKPAVHPR